MSSVHSWGRYLLASILLGLSPSLASAQRTTVGSTGILDPAKALSQYAADAWTMEDGLPQSVVEAVAQTTDGHLWFGTQEGLVRFDGARFEVVDARDTEAMTDNTVRALAAGSQGDIWVGTRDGGLVHLDRDLQATAYGLEHGLPSLTVAAIALDPGGRVWVGTRAGLCVLVPGDGAKFTCYAEEAGLEDPYVRRLLVGRDGTLWLGTRAGLARYEDGEITSLAALGGVAAEPVTSLYEEEDGTLWIGTLYGLALLVDGELMTPEGSEQVAGTEVSALYEDTAGSLWVGTYGKGLVRLHDGDPEALESAAGADLSVVRALVQDQEGSLWIGTMGSGLVRLRDTKFTPYGEAEGFGADMSYSVAAAPGGGVWAATDGGGVARIEGGRVSRTLTTADGLPGDHVSVVYTTRDGALWIGIDGEGVCRYVEAAGVACFGEQDGLPDPFALTFFESPDGTLWVGTDSGLSRWTEQGFAPASAGPEAPVIALAAAGDASLWVGTYGGGLGRYDSQGFTSVSDLDGAVILTLHARPDGTLWVGTDGDGLARVRSLGSGFEVERVTTREGLISDGIFQILEDGQERLWMSSNRGIFHVGLADLDLAARGVVDVIAPVAFRRADGLRTAECNGGIQPAGAVSTDGALWFATAAGVATIDPVAIKHNPLPPPVVVHRVLVDGVPVSLAGDQGLVLPAGSSEFEFNYAGLSFFAPKEVRHRFILDGRDAHWTEVGARREAYYTDLRPGRYVFRVQASNNDGVWNDAGAVVELTLLPHVWQTAWFQALCVLVAGFVAFGGYRARVHQLRARAEHLERVVEERTSELAEQKEIVEAQAGELAALNRSLEQKVRDQLEEILRGSRLRKFFPKKVVDRILSADEDVQVSSERRTVTVFFSDLTGFTRLSDTTPPAVVTRLLNEYLNTMVALVEEHGGTLDKFMGDGIMVLFGDVDEMAPDEQACQAIRMGLAMQRAMVGLASKWDAEGLGHRVAIRMGIHQAEVTVGNFGSDDLVEHTAIGAGVNLASRLEGACAPGGVLVSEAVYGFAATAFAFGAPQQHRLKGIAEPVTAFLINPAMNAAPAGDGSTGPAALEPAAPQRSERR